MSQNDSCLDAVSNLTSSSDDSDKRRSLVDNVSATNETVINDK